MSDDTAPDTTPTEATKRLHAKVVSLQITQGYDDKDRTIEEFITDINAALQAARVKNVTVMGAYYILGGKVCRPGDYDSGTQDRKPGTFPPPWAGGPSESEIRAQVARFGPVGEFGDDTPKPKSRSRKSKPATLAEAAGDLADAMRGNTKTEQSDD